MMPTEWRKYRGKMKFTEWSEESNLRGEPKPLRVEGTPWGDKPSGVTPKGDEVWGGDGPGWTVDEKSSATKVAANAVPDQRTSPEYGRPDSAAQPGTQANGAAAETSDREITNTLVADAAGARLKHGASCEYSLPAPAFPTGDQSNRKQMEKG